MAELGFGHVADLQRTVCSDEITRQLHVMAQARKSSLVKDKRATNVILLCYAMNNVTHN